MTSMQHCSACLQPVCPDATAHTIRAQHSNRIEAPLAQGDMEILKFDMYF